MPLLQIFKQPAKFELIVNGTTLMRCTGIERSNENNNYACHMLQGKTSGDDTLTVLMGKEAFFNMQVRSYVEELNYYLRYRYLFHIAGITR